MDDSTSVPVESSTSATPPSGQAAQTSPASTPTPQVQSESTQSSEPAIPAGYVRQEDLKNLQRQMSQTLTNTQRQAQAQIAQMQQQLAQAQMAGMDDLEKATFRAQQLEAQLQQRYEYDEYNSLLQKRAEKIYEVANKYKVPVEVLQNVQSPEEMYELAMAHKEQEVERLATTRAAEIRELQDHSKKIDLGSGSYTNPRDQRIADALVRKDTSAYYAALLDQGT